MPNKKLFNIPRHSSNIYGINVLKIEYAIIYSSPRRSIVRSPMLHKYHHHKQQQQQWQKWQFFFSRATTAAVSS